MSTYNSKFTGQQVDDGVNIATYATGANGITVTITGTTAATGTTGRHMVVDGLAKLDKITSTGTERVYGITTAGVQETIEVSASSYINSIVKRDEAGAIEMNFGGEAFKTVGPSTTQYFNLPTDVYSDDGISILAVRDDIPDVPIQGLTGANGIIVEQVTGTDYRVKIDSTGSFTASIINVTTGAMLASATVNGSLKVYGTAQETAIKAAVINMEASNGVNISGNTTITGTLTATSVSTPLIKTTSTGGTSSINLYGDAITISGGSGTTFSASATVNGVLYGNSGITLNKGKGITFQSGAKIMGTLTPNSSASGNPTIYLPSSGGTIALKSDIPTGSGSAGVSSIGGKTGAITLSTGLAMSGQQLVNKVKVYTSGDYLCIDTQ